jgi:Astacin (Peptidase family M12A)
MSWRGILAAVLIVCAIIGARQFSKAQQDTQAQQGTYSKAQQDTSSNEEVEICRGKNSVTYEADGKRYSLPFEVVDDQAVLEGDIVFGQATDVLNGGSNYVAPVVPDYVRGEPKRWEGNLLPYIIDASVTASDRAVIQQAIMAWQRATNVRFRQLSGARDWKLENYVKFSGRKNQCSSNSLGSKQRLSGRLNEEDSINVVEVAGCGQNWGRIAHEIGHVLGLGHQHSRGNRDDYIKILWSNIDGPKQFCRVIWDQPTSANTAYDYDSIMHYASTQAARRSSDCKQVIHDGKRDCLAFLPNQEKLEQQRQTAGSNVEPGQRDHLSAGDIALVNMLYPASPPPPSPAQPCVRSTTTSSKVGDRTTATTTNTEPCSPRSRKTMTEPRPDRPRCCGDRWDAGRFCRPDACPAIRVSWPRPDRWCRPGWCRPRRHCDGWIEDGWERRPSDDWDDDRW